MEASYVTQVATYGSDSHVERAALQLSFPIGSNLGYVRMLSILPPSRYSFPFIFLTLPNPASQPSKAIASPESGIFHLTYFDKYTIMRFA